MAKTILVWKISSDSFNYFLILSLRCGRPSGNFLVNRFALSLRNKSKQCGNVGNICFCIVRDFYQNMFNMYHNVICICKIYYT